MTDTNKNTNQDTNMEGLTDDEQLQKLIQSECDKVRTKYSKEIKDMQGKIKEYETKAKKYEQKEKYYKTVDVLEQNDIPSSLAKYISVDIENEEEIKELKEIFKNKDTGYKPTTPRTEDEYSKAIKDNDIEGAIKSKFNRLFQ